MSLKISGYLFYGPFLIEKTKTRANQTPIVFAIVCRTGEPWNPAFRLIDIGRSNPDGLVLTDHPNREMWNRENNGELEVYLFDTPANEGFTPEKRQRIVEEIRANVQPPHGSIPLTGG